MKKYSTEPEETTLQIKFSNIAAAKHFALWLCESGEQQYWDWMEYREEEEEGDITAKSFHYHGEDLNVPISNRKYGEFVNDNVINTRCGRLDKKE